jgi:Adenylate and Guanylate cyclase catalytic domain
LCFRIRIPPPIIHVSLKAIICLCLFASVKAAFGGLEKYPNLIKADSPPIISDGFMALFGIGVDAANHADEALATGRDMLSALEELNTRLLRENREPIAIGIGIHTGPAIVGSIGSPERLEFTAIGSAVNIASRVEGLTKTVDRSLLLTEATAMHLLDKAALENLPPQTVPGVEKPIQIYSAELQSAIGVGSLGELASIFAPDH